LRAAWDGERARDECLQRGSRQTGERAAHLDRHPAEPERTPGRWDREGPPEPAVGPGPQGSATSQARRRLAQDLGGDLARQLSERTEWKDHRAGVERGEALELDGGGSIERRDRVARERRHPGERRRDPRIVGVGEEREQLMANAIAEKLRIAIGRILDPR